MKVPSPQSFQVTPTSTPLAGPSARGATPDAFGAQLAQPLQQFGLAIRDQAIAYQRVNALKALNDFTINENKLYMEAQRSAANNPVGFSESYLAGYEQRQREFLESLPGDVRDDIAQRTDSLRTSLAEDSLRFQFTQTDNAIKQTLTDSVNTSMNELANGGTMDDLAAQRAWIDEQIDTSGLSEAEKVAWRRQAYKNLEATVYKQEQLRRLQAEATGEAPRDMAADIMEQISGRTPDEVGQATYEGETIASRSIGDDEWAALPTRVRATLIAIAAEYGGLTPGIVSAAAAGNLDALAEEIEVLPTEGAELLAGTIRNPGYTIDDDPAFAMVPYEDRLALRADAEREVAAASNAAVQAQNAENAAKVNALHVALLDGNAGQMDIDQAREDGWLQDVQDIEKANKLLFDQTKGIKDVQYAINKLNTGQAFDPYSTDDKNALNAMMNQKNANGDTGIDLLQQRDNEFVENALVPLVRQAGDIPTDAAGLLVGMMRSPDTVAAQWAMDALAQLRQANPAAFDHRIAESDAAMIEFWDKRKDMYTAEQLVTMARGGFTPEERRTNSLLREEAQKKFVGTEGQQLNLDAAALNAIGGRPDTMPGTTRQGLLQDYRVLFEDEYVRSYGNVQVAQEAAIARLKKHWGTSNIGGKPHLMRNPPELAGYRPLNGSFQWMEDQALEELGFKIRPQQGLLEGISNVVSLGRTGAMINAAFDADPRKEIKSFQLLSDPQTQSEADAAKLGGPPPSYLVLVNHVDGTSELLMNTVGPRGNGRLLPRRLFFEVTPEMQQQQLDEFNRRREQVLADEQDMQLEQAIKFHDETGHPIPPDLLELSGKMLEDIQAAGGDFGEGL